MSTTIDRFDLEQQILECWGIIEQIRLYREVQDRLNWDQKDNFLLGLDVIYSAQFDRMFETFGKCVKNKQI